MQRKVFCDTQALIYWALTPQRLSQNAAAALQTGLEQKALACADISLWEIAMLADKRRIVLPASTELFLERLIKGLQLAVHPITPAIAVLAQASFFQHGDPADRLIAATALHYRAPLVTSDARLHAIAELETIW